MAQFDRQKSAQPQLRLLAFSLAADLDDPILSFSARWIRALAERAEYVDIVTNRAGGPRIAPNVRVFSLGKELGLGKPRRAVRFYRCLAGRLGRRHYDAAFAHMTPLFACLAWPLLRLAGVPIVMWYAHGHISRRVRIAARLVNTVVTSSKAGFALDISKRVVLGQGIDTDVYAPNGAEHVHGRLLVVGRLSPIKNCELALAATACLVGEGRDVAVRFVGPVLDPSYAQRLRDIAESSGLADRVEWVGPCPPAQLPSEYRQASLVLNTSQTGSLDKTVLEPMSCGIPVVTTNPAYADLLNQIQPPSYLADPSSEELAAACERILDLDGASRARLSDDLRRLVQAEHDLNHFIERLVGVLASAR